MKIPKIFSTFRYQPVLLLACLLLAACAQEASTLPQVWIDHPRQNLQLEPDQPLLVQSHAFAESGLAEMVLSVDGVPYTKAQPETPGEDFSGFQQEWLPPQEGTYTLQLVAYDTEGVKSNPTTLTIRVGEREVVELPPAPPPEEPPTDTPEPPQQPSCPPLVTVKTDANCRSGPGEVYPVLSALVEGSEAEVAARSQDGYWWVINRPDGGGTCWIWEELVSLSTDSCEVSMLEAPPPPRDQTPPPIPDPAVPANGLTLSCRGTQTLAWLPVQDESGIAGYGLLLEKELSAGSWSEINQWDGIQGKQHQVTVDCGLRYRWSVRAEDGEGNLSAWSGYSSFSLELD